jgi:prophage maintenance system killer protein
MQKDIIMFQTKDGTTSLEVNLKEDTVWLNQKQMGNLFDKDIRTISEHIKNIYQEGELLKSPTIRKFRIVQNEGGRNIQRNIDYYNLDVIISVGYRVKSHRGTQFRIWATKVLKDHIIKGYSIYQKRFREQSSKIRELQRTVKLIESITMEKDLSKDEAAGLINVVTDYIYALDLLDDYDHQRIRIKKRLTRELKSEIRYEDVLKIIENLRNYFKDKGEKVNLFGKEKDHSLKSSISTIFQTFDGKDLYPSVEEKAANLLYFLIKNHSFVDGNKRIAAFMFIWFLKINDILYKENYIKRISDNTLVALCLMVAESNPKDKDTIIKVIINLIS